MKPVYIFVVFLICVSLTVPVYEVRASSSSVEIDELTRTLHAIQAYIARATGAHESSLTKDELRTSIRAGVEWIKNAQEENGHFRYEYFPYEDTYSNDDNIVRQTGALYALGEILRRSEGDTLKVRSTMKRAFSYVEQHTQTYEIANETRACVVLNDVSMRCSLGATSLALVGMLAYVEKYPAEESAYEDRIDAYRTYILSMQKPSGGFRDSFTIGSSRIRNTESPFSNGEAMLALVRSLMHTEDTKTQSAIDLAFQYLKTQTYDSNLYLWMMAALRDLDAHSPQSEYKEYAKSFTLWRIEKAKSLTDRTRNYCAYVEGLSSALSMIDKEFSRTEHETLVRELAIRNRNHLNLQIGESDGIRLIMKEKIPTLVSLTDFSHARGGFLTGDSEPSLRIDFTQHCITGYVQTLVDVERGAL